MASLATYINENFPSPAEGDEFLWGGVRYTYDSTPGIWAGSIPDPDAVQDVATNTQPEDPINGELWYDRANERMNVFVDGAWVDANPQPTADDLGLMPTVAVTQDGSVVEFETSVINFTGNTIATLDEAAQGQVNISSRVPLVPDANTTESQSLILNIPAEGNGSPSWSSLADAGGNLKLDDLDQVSAPFDTTPVDNILVRGNSNFELKSASDLGLATATTVTALTGRVTTAETDIDNVEGRLDTAEGTISTQGTDLTDARTRLTAAETDIDTLETAIDNLSLPTDDDGNLIPNVIPTLITDLQNIDNDILALELKSLTDVSDSLAPSTGHVLTYRDGSWTSETTQVPASSGNAVSIGDSGRSIIIDGTTTQIPVITAASIDSSNNLVLDVNGSDTDVTVSLSSIIQSGNTFNLTVEDTQNINTINFSDNFTVTSSSGAATVEVNFPDMSEITGDVGTNKTDIASLQTTTGMHTMDISGIKSAANTLSTKVDGLEDDIESNDSDITDLSTRITALEEGGSGGTSVVATPLVIQQDSSERNSDTNTINFTGDGVTVTNKGSGRVEVNIEGGVSAGSDAAVGSPAFIQTAFDKSLDKANKQEFHLNGGANGSKYRIIAKNNGTSPHSIKYETSTTKPNDSIASGVSYSDKPGLWDSDDEQFIIFPLELAGQVNWPPGMFAALASGSVTQLEIDVKPNGRVSFSSNSNNIIWSYATIGGFAEDSGTDDSGGEEPIVPAEPAAVTQGSSFANGDNIEGMSGPFFVRNEPDHYNMQWTSGSGAGIIYDRILGGDDANSQVPTPFGNPIYGKVFNNSFEQGVWAVGYYTPNGSLNDNTSLTWGVTFPSSVGEIGNKDAGLTALETYYTESHPSFSGRMFKNEIGPDNNAQPDANFPGSYAATFLIKNGPNLGAYGDQYSFASWTGGADWHSFQSCRFWLSGSNTDGMGSRAIDIRRGKLRSVRQSPSNTAARLAAFEMYYRVYIPEGQ